MLFEPANTLVVDVALLMLELCDCMKLTVLVLALLMVDEDVKTLLLLVDVDVLAEILIAAVASLVVLLVANTEDNTLVSDVPSAGRIRK